MRLFFYPLFLTIALLLAFAEFTFPILQHKRATNTLASYTLPVHKTLYLERGLYIDQINHIIAASMEWNQVTNGDVVFDIKVLPQTDINPNDAIIMFNVTPDYPEVIVVDNRDHNISLAIYSNDNGLANIAIVDERIVSDEYDATIMHELGHSLGLDHPNTPSNPYNGVGSLMYSVISLGSDHITNSDLEQFCHLYHCDAGKYHVVSEVQ